MVSCNVCSHPEGSIRKAIFPLLCLLRALSVPFPSMSCISLYQHFLQMIPTFLAKPTVASLNPNTPKEATPRRNGHLERRKHAVENFRKRSHLSSDWPRALPTSWADLPGVPRAGSLKGNPQLCAERAAATGGVSGKGMDGAFLE